MKIALFTGELSGDLYGYHLLRALSALLEGNIEAFGIGGPNLQRLSFFEGIADISDLSIMGVVDALKDIKRLWRLFHNCVRRVLDASPSVVLLIDSPDFNLRLAKALRGKGWKGKIVYFIPPTAWIWRSGRAKILRNTCDLVITLFDFEASWYESRGVNARFLGHPLLDLLPESGETISGLKKPVLACFPGSRASEVKYLLPVLKDVSGEWEGDFLFSKVPSLPVELYNGVSNLLEVPSHLLLRSCDFVVAASGTIAVEAMIYEKPAVIIYKGSFLNYLLYKILVNARFISMPNIMLGREVYPELLQSKANKREILRILERWLSEEEEVAGIKRILKKLKRRLGSRGAIGRIASLLANEALASG